MANERTWTAGATAKAFDSEPFALGSFSAESNGVLRTAPTLYFIKETLVETGAWEVVSSSYRTDATGSTYPTQSATYGQNLASGGMTKFAAVAGDSWKTYTASLHVGNSSYSDGNTIPNNEMHRIIYPVAYNLTGGLNPGGVDGSVRDTGNRGRSWCLLKHTPSGSVGLKQRTGGKDLYLVLDYVSSHYLSTNTTLTSSIATTENINTLFGHSINIVYFYGEPQNTIAPTPQIRPYRNDELTFSSQNSTYKISNNGNVLINPIETGPRSIKVNHTYTSETDGFYIFVSQTGVPTFVLGADKIKDSISDVLTSKQNTGNVVFMAYSAVARNAFNIAGTIVADLFIFDKTATGTTNGFPPYTANWSNLTYYNPIKYFKTAGNGSTSSGPSNVFCTFPSYVNTDPTPNVANVRGLLSLTANNSSATRDGTYLEFPLPILEAQDDVTKVRYAGRFADVKLGPALGIDGALAKEVSTDEIYDRILLSGLWFPYGSDSPADL